MEVEFGDVLRGLMANRRLTVHGLCVAAGLAHADVGRLLHGDPPRPRIIREIAPALGMSPNDLLVIAGLSVTDVAPRKQHPLHRELIFLRAAASRLSREQVETLITHAYQLHQDSTGTSRDAEAE
jgi:transcriptional regulator with XRE-family HTH domain